MLTFDDMNLSEPLRIYDKQASDVRIPPTYVDSFASFVQASERGMLQFRKCRWENPWRRSVRTFSNAS